jgi:hypothetical protein
LQGTESSISAAEYLLRSLAERHLIGKRSGHEGEVAVVAIEARVVAFDWNEIANW